MHFLQKQSDYFSNDPRTKLTLFRRTSGAISETCLMMIMNRNAFKTEVYALIFIAYTVQVL